MPIIPGPPATGTVPGLNLAANDIIRQALLSLGVISGTETPSADMAQDSLVALNQLLDSWQADRLMIYTIQRQTYPLTTGQQVYTYGSGGNFNFPRPAKIERMGIINLNNPVQPLELPLQYLTVAQWQEIPVKNIQSALPQYCWDDQAFPLRNLSFWPVPNVVTNAAIYPWIALTQFVDLVTKFTFPPAYAKALRFNLALDIAPEYGVSQINPLVVKAAGDAKYLIEAMNAPLIDLRCDPALVSTRKSLYNWLTDMPAGR